MTDSHNSRADSQKEGNGNGQGAKSSFLTKKETGSNGRKWSREHQTSWFQFSTAHNVERLAALPVHNCYISRVKEKKKKKKYVLLALSEIAWSAGASLLTSPQICHKDKEIEREAVEAGKRITGACWLEENWKYKTNVHPSYVATFKKKNCGHIGSSWLLTNNVKKKPKMFLLVCVCVLPGVRTCMSVHSCQRVLYHASAQPHTTENFDALRIESPDCDHFCWGRAPVDTPCFIHMVLTPITPAPTCLRYTEESRHLQTARVF